MMKPFLVIVLVFSAIFAGGGVMAAQANAAMPGDMLYAVDRGIESLRLDLATNPQAALDLQTQFAMERLQEVRALDARGELGQADGLFEQVSEQLADLEAVSQANGGGQSVADLLNQAYEAGSPLAPGVDDNGNENGNENANGNQNGNGNENANGNGTFKQPKGGGHCSGTATRHHPHGDALAAEYSVDYGEVMGYFCQGYGFGEISLAYQLSKQSGAPVSEIFAQRGGGQGWGQLMKQYGLNGKSGKTGGNDGSQGSGQDNNNGKGKGNGGVGNGNGKGNGENGKNNGNSKGNGKGKKP